MRCTGARLHFSTMRINHDRVRFDGVPDKGRPHPSVDTLPAPTTPRTTLQANEGKFAHPTAYQMPVGPNAAGDEESSALVHHGADFGQSLSAPTEVP